MFLLPASVELIGVVCFRIDQVEDELKKIPSSPSQSYNITHELVMLSLPAIAGQAIDPLVQLMETAFVGRLGRVDLVVLKMMLPLSDSHLNNLFVNFNHLLMHVPLQPLLCCS